MIKKIIASENKLMPGDLLVFENEYGISLPANYKKLILKYNGGQIEDSDEIKKILDAFADAPGFDKAVREMSQQWSKFHGGTFVLDYAGKLVGKGKTIRFEVETFTNYMGKKIDFRRHDIEFEELLPNGRLRTTKLELKNWTGFWGESIKTQFIKDLKKIDSFVQLKWIFNKKGMNQNIDELRQSVIKNLRKSDGTPISELREISIDQIRKLFPGELFDDADYIEQLLNNLNKPEIFSQLFQIVE